MDREDVPSPASRCDDPFADDPLGLAVEQLFQASLELHGALALIPNSVARRRVRRAIDRIDDAVMAIRRKALEREFFGDLPGDHGLSDMIGEQAGEFDPDGLTDWLGNVPTVDAVAVTLHGRADAVVVSSNGESGRRASVVELAASPGPGEIARTTGRPVVVTDLWADDGPWPRLPESSRAAGLRCAYAVPIRFGEDILGSLDLYSERAGGLDLAAVQAADTLAVAAAVGIVRRRCGDPRAEEAEGARTELGELVAFQRAAGALSVRHGLTLDQATALMADYAREQGQRTAVVATLVLEGAEDVINDLATRHLPDA